MKRLLGILFMLIGVVAFGQNYTCKNLNVKGSVKFLYGGGTDSLYSIRLSATNDTLFLNADTFITAGSVAPTLVDSALYSYDADSLNSQPSAYYRDTLYYSGTWVGNGETLRLDSSVFVRGTGSNAIVSKTGLDTASGAFSFAVGDSSTASGINSISMGQECKAIGDYSLATGRRSLAQGYSSIAMGDSANAKNSKSISIGNYAFAGIGSISIGDSAGRRNLGVGFFIDSSISIGRYALGDYKCISIGNNSRAAQHPSYGGSTSIGNGCTSYAGSFSGGYACTAIDRSVSIGGSAYAGQLGVFIGQNGFGVTGGPGSINIGYNHGSSGTGCVSIGNNLIYPSGTNSMVFSSGGSRATGQSSIMIGSGPEGSGVTRQYGNSSNTYSVCIGSGSTYESFYQCPEASGVASIALGNSTSSGTGSFSAGYYNMASGAYSVAFGIHGKTISASSMTFGGGTFDSLRQYTGQAQAITVQMSDTTQNNSGNNLRVGGAYRNISEGVPIPISTAAFYEVTVIGIDTAASPVDSMITKRFFGMIYNVGGTTAKSTDTTTLAPMFINVRTGFSSLIDAAIYADDTNDKLQIKVWGNNSCIRWSATVRMTFISFKNTTW